MLLHAFHNESALTWVKVGLHDDTDSAALPQVSDTDALEVLPNIGIAEKLIQLLVRSEGENRTN